jgi:low temperature requirement protein LtrA
MAGDEPRGALYRPRVPNQHSRVTYAELFFDLVFAFAVTQLSHTLLAEFTPLGALQTTLLFLAVWWLWIYTAWVTNWLNPELTPGSHHAVRTDVRRSRAFDRASKGL